MHPLLRLPCRAEGDNAGTGEPKVETPAVEDVAALKAQLATLQAADAKRAADAKKATEADAKRRGDHEQLLTAKDAELATLAERVASYEKVEAARLAKVEAANAKRVKDIPEARRSLVPASLKGDELDEYITTNWALLKGDDLATGTKRATGTADLDEKDVPADIAAEAARRGMAPLAWFNVLKKAGRLKAAGTTS